ncbi:hypothetical protein [Ideonella livida]|uniref:Uncharacterized protein n=1 Tax=Ideonella livida TaxID=2707176 RepID=A0A7C9PIP4_9BURK|nr:hypothetical protein [Ideonella livida]NDY92997.1 hypothetical protein [Ideonella livida]
MSRRPALSPLLPLVLALAAPPALAQKGEPVQLPEAEEAVPDAKVANLLGMVAGQVGALAFEAAVGEPPSDFFRRLWHRWVRQRDGSQPPTAAQAAAAAASQAPAADPQRLVPAIGYSLEQLDPQTFEPLRQLPLARKPPVLRTGDVFVLRYAASLPGQVRLENIDSTGKISDLGTYTVWPDRTNRLPADRGIRLEGAPGPEVIRVYFYPCLPDDAQAQPWASVFRERLSACGTGQAAAVAAAARGLQRSKAMVSLAQPDPTMAFSGAEDYQRGDVVSTVVMLQHESR